MRGRKKTCLPPITIVMLLRDILIVLAQGVGGCIVSSTACFRPRQGAHRTGRVDTVQRNLLTMPATIFEILSFE